MSLEGDASSTAGRHAADRVPLLVREGRFDEALTLAFALFARSPSAASGEMVAEVARHAGERETELLVVAATLALGGPSSAVLRRLCVCLVEAGHTDLAVAVAAEAMARYMAEVEHSGLARSPEQREAFLAQLPPAVRLTAGGRG